MQKIKDLLTIIALLALIIFSSCAPLKYSGTYRIKSLGDNTATFYGLAGEYVIPTKGLKIGQKIRLERITKKEAANVFLIK